jgi:hypothetical protein
MHTEKSYSVKQDAPEILRWVDNIKMDLGEIGWDGMGWYGLDRTGSG